MKEVEDEVEEVDGDNKLKHQMKSGMGCVG